MDSKDICCIPCEIESPDTLVPCCSKSVHHRMHRECLQQFIIAIIENQTEDYRTSLVCPLCRDNYLEQLRELFETSIKKRITSPAVVQQEERPTFGQLLEVVSRLEELSAGHPPHAAPSPPTPPIREITELPLSSEFNEMTAIIMQNRFDFRDFD